MSNESVLSVRRDQGVLVLTLNRPDARNALNIALTRALTEQFRILGDDETLRAAVITGSDPAFCAGLDLKDFSDANSPRGEVSALLALVPELKKPVIAAVNGAAMTGGLELAMGCDFIIASDKARFGDTHTKIGALAGGGMNSRLPRKVGMAWAKQMIFTCQPIDAATALRIGLANEVVTHDQLVTRAIELARAIAAHDPGLVVLVKQTLDQGGMATLGEAIALERQALTDRKSKGGMQWKK